MKPIYPNAEYDKMIHSLYAVLCTHRYVASKWNISGISGFISENGWRVQEMRNMICLDMGERI